MATVVFYRKKAGHLVRIFEEADAGNRDPFYLRNLTARRVDEYISQRRREGRGRDDDS